MRIHRSIMAHLRLFPAHGPEPMKAPGAAQACPTCLPSPSHQLTRLGDLRLGCPLQKGPRFAPGHSSIGGSTSRKALVPESSPKRDQLWSVPFLLEKAHLRVNPSLADGLPNRSGRSHTAKTFPPYQPTAQTSGYLPACLAPERSYGFRANTRPDPDRPPTTRNDHNSDTAHGQSHSLLADSKTSAYPIETPLLQFAFNPINASWHLGRPDLINPIRRSHVRQDSDFRWKSRVRKKPGFSSVPSGVRRPSERLALAHQTPSVEINT